ncbi:DUF6491 family protein [Asticcacaulis sp. DXS10W]|jgi:hypothetical protein|uniref:DUF6491 family protein n=1 Tax=Asticcacaulis currens TaxID=2984210 RepID=A0ABT5IFC2_9CAUL|nr:DUF6491 family protein [Asticcacaulis currens]MDC7694874.1 DUF6491 family protein [Asticcacaulis currens]
MKTLMTVAALAAAGLTTLSLLPAQAQSVGAESSAPPEREAPKAQKDMRKCFRSEDIDRFNPIDSRTMVIETYGHQHYRLELSGACMGIEDAFRIGVRTRGGSIQVCGGFDAEILYSEPGSGRLTRCNITDVKPITKDEADRIEGVTPRTAENRAGAGT